MTCIGGTSNDWGAVIVTMIMTMVIDDNDCDWRDVIVSKIVAMIVAKIVIIIVAVIVTKIVTIIVIMTMIVIMIMTGVPSNL